MVEEVPHQRRHGAALDDQRPHRALGDTFGYVRTRSAGTLAPKGRAPAGKEGNREIFIVKKVDGAWKVHRYIFNAEVGC